MNVKGRSKMECKHFSGVFGVYDRTTLLKTGAAGLANRDFTIQNDPAFSYQTASGTKGFTAAAIFTLVAEGKIRLEDRAKDLLAESPDAEKYGALDWLSDTVTIRSLLCHTSGVPDYFDEETMDNFEDALDGTANYHYEKPEQFFPLAEKVWKKQLAPYASRNVFKYSNGGFVILAVVVEAISGVPFGDYVSSHVFTPFGMKQSGFFRFDGPVPEVIRASAYQKNGRSNIYAVPVIGGGDGGAYTNPSDMAKFWNQLDPEINPGHPLARLMKEAWTPQQEAEDNRYGLGFWISGKNPRIVFLEGFDPGVQFFSYYNRDTKRSLTICLNDEAMNCDEIFEQYYTMVE